MFVNRIKIGAMLKASVAVLNLWKKSSTKSSNALLRSV